MNEQDLRDCFAMFAMMGLVMREGVTSNSGLEIDAWVMADKMMATRKVNYNEPEVPEVGIVAIKKKRYVRKN